MAHDLGGGAMTPPLSSPRYMVPLEVLRASGKAMTTREWFTSDPRLASLSMSDRKSIVLKLRAVGYIEHGPRTRVYTAPDGQPCRGVRLDTWRVR